MKKILLFIIAVFVTCSVFSQEARQVIWKNGDEVVTLKAAKEGVTMKSGDRSVYSNSQASGNIGIECRFEPSSLISVNEGKAVEFEVKWYYYMSTKRSLMSTAVVAVDPNTTDNYAKLLSTKSNARSGWWEVVIKNKITGQVVTYANQEVYQIKLN